MAAASHWPFMGAGRARGAGFQGLRVGGSRVQSIVTSLRGRRGHSAHLDAASCLLRDMQGIVLTCDIGRPASLLCSPPVDVTLAVPAQ
jgi:hypothetical protein